MLGPLAGLLWAHIAPEIRFVVVRGRALLADPEGQGPIGTDARFALIAVGLGVLCGGAAYLAGGRGNDIALLLGLAAGGAAAAVLAWRTGHHVGLADFRAAVAAAPDGRVLSGPADLRALGVLTFWPMASVGSYAFFEVLVKRLPAGDHGGRGAGQGDQVGGGQFDLEAAPAGRDVDGRER
ncbi:hypothetical protein [Actinomadura flavalba]|uniref:hypothetical protein n=1 Tax=Actinomadura flavalba TaxID=1120938 RepID=UPI001F0AB621|nr:hypothetical protein [Actinomadura flavalba]